MDIGGKLLRIWVQPEASAILTSRVNNHDWIVPFSVVIVLLACIISFTILRYRQCKEAPANEGLSMDNECLIASLFLVLFVIVVLGSFYYYYCVQGGCFGRGGPFSKVEAPPSGRKMMRM